MTYKKEKNNFNKTRNFCLFVFNLDSYSYSTNRYHLNTVTKEENEAT